MLPSELRVLPFDDMLILIEAKRVRQKDDQQIMKFQTALIVEALIGSGKGVQFVNNSWRLDESDNNELTPDKIKQLLKKKREREALRKRNG